MFYDPERIGYSDDEPDQIIFFPKPFTQAVESGALSEYIPSFDDIDGDASATIGVSFAPVIRDVDNVKMWMPVIHVGYETYAPEAIDERESMD